MKIIIWSIILFLILPACGGTIITILHNRLPVWRRWPDKYLVPNCY